MGIIILLGVIGALIAFYALLSLSDDPLEAEIEEALAWDRKQKALARIYHRA